MLFDVIYGKQMNYDEINYRTLRKIQDMERNSPVLSKIDPNFYSDLSNYLEKLNYRLEKEKSPQKLMLLKDEIHNTNTIVNNIYEHREKKILLAAISKVRGGNPDMKNLVNLEKNLFNSIFDMLIKSREKVLGKKSKENKQKNVKSVEKEPEIKKPEKHVSANPIVMIKKDIPEFIGTDTKRYNLRKGDVLSLPENMTDMLTKRGVAKKVDQQ